MKTFIIPLFSALFTAFFLGPVTLYFVLVTGQPILWFITPIPVVVYWFITVSKRIKNYHALLQSSFVYDVEKSVDTYIKKYMKKN